MTALFANVVVGCRLLVCWVPAAQFSSTKPLLRFEPLLLGLLQPWLLGLLAACLQALRPDPIVELCVALIRLLG